MTWQPTAKWMKDAALFLVAPSLILNIFFLTDTYRIIQSIPTSKVEHDRVHDRLESEHIAVIKEVNALRNTVLEEKTVNAEQTGSINKINIMLQIMPE